MKIIVNKSYLSTTQGSSILPKLVCMVLLLISSPLPACGFDSAEPSTSQDPDLCTNESEGAPRYDVDINAMIKEAIERAKKMIAQQAEDSQQHSTEEVVRPEEENAPQDAVSQQPSTAVRQAEERNDQQDAGSQQPSTLDLENQSSSSRSINTQERASGS